MVQDNAQMRRRGAHDFLAYYDFVCARQESLPLSAVKLNLDKGILEFHGDRVKQADWPPILKAISINKHLHHIAVRSSAPASPGSGDADRRYYKCVRRKIPALRSKDMTFKLCKALKDCLTVSPNLKTLQLNGLPLRERDLITLTKGLAKSSSLENLSLANCPIADEGLEVICQSVKYSTNIRTVDFTGCNLTWRGAEHMANIIKHQGMQRHGTAWAESLRYRKPQYAEMGGLRRVTLNCNTLIGDRGAAALAHELAEDLWVKAVDMQRCGLSNEGARRLLEALKTNSAICVLDIRCNPLVDKILIKTIIERLLMSTDQQTSEYCWIKPAASEPQRAFGPKRRVMHGAVRGKARRSAPQKGTPPGGQSSGAVQHQKPFSRCRYVPWRTAARAGRQRGLPPGLTVTDNSFQGAATVKVTVESDSEGEEDEEAEVVVESEQRSSVSSLREKITEKQFERLQMELKECRLRLAEERRARLKAESRLMEYELENARLRDNNLSMSEALEAAGSASVQPALSSLEDEAVLDSIESSFNKFHAFLDLFKDAGLGQIASMAGIDKSDFHPVGKPQLSSTMENLAHLDGAPSPFTTGGNHQNHQAKAGDSFLGSSISPAHLDGLAHATPPRSSMHADRLHYVTFRQAAGPAAVSSAPEPDRFSKPDTQQDAASERSFCSQKSSKSVSLGKTFPTRLKSRTSSPHSYRSSGGGGGGGGSSSGASPGHSFSYSYTHSNPSFSNGELSARSSVSDIISERGESLQSGRKRGLRRLVSVGQSGEGPEVTGYPGKEALAQVRSLAGFSGQSGHESF